MKREPWSPDVPGRVPPRRLDVPLGALFARWRRLAARRPQGGMAPDLPERVVAAIRKGDTRGASERSLPTWAAAAAALILVLAGGGDRGSKGRRHSATFVAPAPPAAEASPEIGPLPAERAEPPTAPRERRP